MDAIVYTSNSGYTAHYASLLGEATGLAVYSLKGSDCPKAGSEIIYLGWLMAGGVKGAKKALARYHVRALCAVGMGVPGTQPPESITKQNKLPEDLPVFYLQGGFDINKLHGIYKLMMSAMSRGAGKKLAEKSDRTPEEDEMLDMMQNGGDCVKVENLQSIVEWWETQH